MSFMVKTFDGKDFETQRLSRKPRKAYLRAGHKIGVLPDGRELVEFYGEWFWLLRGASRDEILLVGKLLKEKEKKHGD